MTKSLIEELTKVILPILLFLMVSCSIIQEPKEKTEYQKRCYLENGTFLVNNTYCCHSTITDSEDHLLDIVSCQEYDEFMQKYKDMGCSDTHWTVCEDYLRQYNASRCILNSAWDRDLPNSKKVDCCDVPKEGMPGMYYPFIPTCEQYLEPCDNENATYGCWTEEYKELYNNAEIILKDELEFWNNNAKEEKERRERERDIYRD